MITIHVGLHKTGSSSIQTALRLRRPERGSVQIVPTEVDDRSNGGWSSRLSALAAAGAGVLSDENFLGTPFDGYAQASERIDILRNCLEGVEFQVVVYVRPQIDWLPSVYLQAVQEGRALAPLEFWSAVSTSPSLYWASLIARLQADSGAQRVVVRAHVTGRDVVADFFSTCALGPVPRVGPSPIHENRSISAAQAPVLRAVGSDPSLTEADRRRLRTVFQGQLAAGAPRGGSPFPVSLQVEISEAFSADWTRLAESLATTDPSESKVMLDANSRWSLPPAPWVGDDLESPEVKAELLRSLRVLALNGAQHAPSLVDRLVSKLRDDPAGIPQAAMRAIRGQR